MILSMIFFHLSLCWQRSKDDELLTSYINEDITFHNRQLFVLNPKKHPK